MALPSARVTLPESVQLQNVVRGGGQPVRFAVPGGGLAKDSRARPRNAAAGAVVAVKLF